MKDFFNRRQRFSLRKYSFGVASVLLGTALFAAHSVQADEVATPTVTAGNPSTSVAGESSSSLVNTTTTAPQSNPAASVTSPSASATFTSTIPLGSPASELPSASTTETTSTATASATTATAAATASSTPTAAGTTSVGSAPSSSTGATSTSAVTPTAVQPTVAQPVASTTQPTATTQPVSAPTATQPVASTQPTSASVAQPATTTLTTSTPSPTSAANTAALTTMLTANPMSAAGTAPEVRSRSSRRRRSLDNPESTSYTTGAATATPTMSDPNGAMITNRPLVVPTPKDPTNHVTAGINYQLNPSASQYTYIVTDLMGFNTEYNTKFYYRMSKPYDNSTNVTIELVDGATNTVKETKQISGAGTVNLGQATLAPISGNKQAYIEFRFENVKDADKTDRPALRATWKFNGSANDFDGQRTAIQIYDVVNTANEGTTITDPQYYIPRLTHKTTYYKVVDKNASTYNKNRLVGKFVQDANGDYIKNSSTAGDYKLVNKDGTPDVNTQSYRETGNEESLGSFTLTAMEGQNFHASALRAFEGYSLYQTADSRSLIDVLKKPYQVGQRWFDVANPEGGVKRIKEVVGEDGTVRIEMWAIKSDSLNKISKDLNTDGYVKVYETVIRPGSNNKIDHPEDFGKNPEIDDAGWNKDNNKPVRDGLKPELRDKLVVGKPFAIFSDKQNTNYLGDLEYGKPNVADFIYKRPNGTFYKMTWGGDEATNTIEYAITEVSASEAAGYQPRYSAAGEFYANRGGTGAAYTINGVPVSSGNVFRLENKLTPSYETVYYYVKNEPIDIELNLKKVLKSLNTTVQPELKEGDFSFNITNVAADPANPLEKDGPAINATVTNKEDGSIPFTQKITQADGTEKEVSLIQLDKVGIYKYRITEVAGSDTEVDYDGMSVIATVTVTEKKDSSGNYLGEYEYTVTYTSKNGQDASGNTTDPKVSATNPTGTGTDTEFNNFVVAPVNIEFDFTKKLSGRNLKANEFTFNLLNEAGAVVGTAKNDANGNIKFTGIKYKVSDLGTNSAGKRNDSKTFNYTVKEVVPTTAEAGMSYDQMEAKVAVTVTKTGHTLTTATTYSSVNGIDANGNPTTGVDKEFNNTFTPNPVKVNLEFDKSLSNGTLNAGDFSFKLTGDGNVNETVTNKANGKINFSTLSFDKAGVYNYTVKEVAGTNTDVDYDAMTINVKVTVTKDANTGLLSASTVMTSSGGEATDANDRVFNNFVVPAIPIRVDFKKALVGRSLKANEFTFEMKDSAGTVVATGTNDANGVVTFNQLPKVKNAQVGQTIKYYVSEKVPSNKEFGVTYDSMVAEVSVTVSKNADHTLKATVTYPGGDTEFNNTVTPPTTPDFQPEKFIVNKKKFDITGNKLMDDDNELTNEYTETNADPYVDKTNNNEPENLNTKTVKKGDEIVYQVWLDTTNLKASDNIQAVGISDKYEADKLKINAADIKAYDSVTGTDVTSKFVITVNNGEITATSKDEFIKDKVIDTTKFEFGRYYKFDIPATVKTTTPDGVDIENTANQIVHQYDPTKRDITKPEKPTQKRVVNLPVPLEFDFTKKLDGRNLVENEFTFVLKKDGVAIQTVKNSAPDATTGIAKIAFKPLEFTKADAGNTFTYTVEEVAGTDATVSYDNMVATIKVEVKHDGTTKATVVNMLQDAPDKEFNNTVKPPEEPKFNPEKYVVSKEKFDITGDKLLDDDSELADKYGDTNANPYADGTANNEPENLNTKTVKPGSKLVYQVWLDTKQFSATNTENIQTVGITDNYDEAKLDVNSIKVYDSVTGSDVTSKFDIANTGGVITATLKAGFTKSLGDANNTQIIDTTKFAFGRYYKFDIVTTVKTDAPAGKDIENTAGQIVHYYNARTNKVEKPEKPTEKRVNSVPVPLELKFTKALDGRTLQAGEFEFILEKDGVEVERVKNDAAGKINFKKLEFGKDDLGKTYSYTVHEVTGSDATVTYDTMVATVRVSISHDGTAKAIVKNVVDAPDKEFNNKVKPPEEPNFNPEKYVVSTEKFDITGDKLLDDDSELADKYGDTNANPYVDGTANNEPENLNTKTVKPGSKLVYQVWLDTKQFSATNTENIQTVGITDNYDEAKLDVNSIKVYDSVTGSDVTSKFDIANTGGVITATLKAGFTKSLGDANNTQIIDTTKFAFGRYYKFDIVTTVKTDAPAGKDIENTAGQIVHYYNPRTNTVEKPEKPTEKRVNSVPVPLELNFTKKLDGRQLKANEFTFVLKKDGVEVERAKNGAPDATTGIAKINFTKLEFGKDDIGKTYNYTVEEVKGTDSTVSYDGMVATVRVSISHDGTAKAIVKNVVDAPDKEFDNRVTPPEEPKFNPEKYVVRDEDFDLTGKKLLDDDSELADKYGDTKINPYADKSNNNEKVTVRNDKGELEEVFENLNTQPVKRGQKFYYQVWLDTTQFSANNKENIQTVGITDNYDESKLIVTKNTIKVYDGETGADVTSKFDVAVTNGIITANLKSGFTKSLGDANNTQVIDTTKFEFGRYYKVVIPATVSQDAYDGSEIENTATQTVHYYNPRTHTVESPDKPTQKRVNNIPTAIQLIFGKTLNGRKLQADEFSFVLKDKETNKILEKAKNDADGKVTFKTINYSKADIGQTFNYIVEEEKGDKPGVTYDDMKVNVTVQVIQPSSGDQLSTVISYATEGGDAFTADDTVFDNNVTPNFKPEKYVVSKEKFDLKGTKLLDDDAPNGKVEAENLNHHTLTRGQKFYYQVWLDTREFTAESNIQSVGITDDYDEAKLDIDESAIKVYDGETDVTDKFDISIKNGVIYATSKPSLTKPISATDATPVIDTTKFAFGRYYKFDIPATVKNIKDNDGVEFSNTANEIVHQYNPYNKQVTTPKKPTQTRENNVPVPLEFNYTKKLEGRELTAGEFSFLLKAQDGKVLQTVSNDKDGHIKFEQLLFSKADLGKTFTYTVEEVNDNKPGISYDAMKATVTVQVTKDGKILKTVVNHASAGGNATDANDKEFNNKVVPPEKPKFQPEKYVVNQEKFDITGDKLVDDDKELADKYADTNANPYVDKTDNNEKENLNTKTVKRGDKLVYQVWLDTTKFDANNKDYIQTVGITDNYDEKKLNVNQSDIKAYDGKTGKDVTAMFDIKVENGVITANLKDGFTKSLGDKDNTQIIDTTKFAFGRYYKFDIPAIVKDSKNEKGEFDVPSGSDIENTAGQTVHYYDPTVKKVVKTPEKPTEKRVVNISASVTFEFTKKLEGRDLKAGEFSFVLKDRKGKVIETVSNDADGKIKFSALEYKHGEEGIHFYTVEEVKGNDTTVTYDKMVAKVTVLVAKGGNVMTVTSKLPEDTEFNNIVTPPTPPTPVVPPVTPPTPPTPVVPPVTPPTPPTPVVPPVTPPTPPTPVVPPVTPPTPPTPVVPPVTPPTPPTPVVPPVTPPTSPEVSREQGLPKTGENKSVVAMAFGGLLAAAGLGLAGKRKKED
ncbi:Spy0128 family protein [Streptococcus salivarius]